jgi:hypothetical protein
MMAEEFSLDLGPFDNNRVSSCFTFFAVKTTLSMNGSFPNLRPVRSRSQAFGPETCLLYAVPDWPPPPPLAGLACMGVY